MYLLNSAAGAFPLIFGDRNGQIVLLAVVALSQQWLSLINRLQGGSPASWREAQGLPWSPPCRGLSAAQSGNGFSVGISAFLWFLGWCPLSSVVGAASITCWAPVYKLCCLWHALNFSSVSDGLMQGHPCSLLGKEPKVRCFPNISDF